MRCPGARPERSRHQDRGQPGEPHEHGRRVRQGPCRHPGALQPEPPAVPLASRGRARWQRLGAHLLGRGHHGYRDQDQRDFRQVRFRGHHGVHRRWRQPALLQREVVRRVHQHAERVGARLRPVLPAPHGRLAAGLRRRQAEQPVLRGLQRLGLLLRRHAGDEPGAVGHRPVQLLRRDWRSRAGGAACSRAGPQDGGHRPAHDLGRVQGRRVAAHPPGHRRRAASGMGALDY